MVARIVLLVTSPRLPAGLLTAAAWDTVRSHPVFAGAESELITAIRVSGAEVTVTPAEPVATLLATAHERGTAVWLAGPAGDQELARELGLRLAREPGLAELELMYGSWDPPGARLLDAVAVMDRLASPGGDPWKRAQTHQTLARFLLEECYEAYDAISAGDLDALRDELGDVLLQVVLHARLAEERTEGDAWNVDDVAGGLVAKMIRRNPHVFAGATAESIEEITENWERIKQAERTRESVLDGIPLAQPALSLAEKILSRVDRAGLDVPLPPVPAKVGLTGPESDPGRADERPATPISGAAAADARWLAEREAELGARLLALVDQSRRAGLDAEAALRRVTLAYADTVRAAERSGADRGEPPGEPRRPD